MDLNFMPRAISTSAWADSCLAMTRGSFGRIAPPPLTLGIQPVAASLSLGQYRWRSLRQVFYFLSDSTQVTNCADQRSSQTGRHRPRVERNCFLTSSTVGSGIASVRRFPEMAGTLEDCGGVREGGRDPRERPHADGPY